MKSMTGFGKGQCEREGIISTVEVSSVNRKQLDIRFNQVAELRAFEADYRKVVSAAIGRGTVNVKIVLTSSLGTSININKALAAKYVSELKALAIELDIEPTLSISDVANFPDVISEQVNEVDHVLMNEITLEALNEAIQNLVEMRAVEGAELEKDLIERQEILAGYVAEIEQQSPTVVLEYQTKLKERVKKLLQGEIEIDPMLLAQEVAVFAERADISEEITRLKSHFIQFLDLLSSPAPVGRNLDFLVQEIYREINTTGTKAHDSIISTNVVRFKTELEKIREQVQNVE